MDSFWSKPTFWASIVVVGVVMAGISAGVQSQTDEKKIKNKAVLRDGILGAIFATIVWVLSPETMDSVTTTATSFVSDAGQAVKDVATVASDMDVQIGPAKF